jgi:hypothetical protein
MVGPDFATHILIDMRRAVDHQRVRVTTLILRVLMLDSKKCGRKGCRNEDHSPRALSFPLMGSSRFTVRQPGQIGVSQKMS